MSRYSEEAHARQSPYLLQIVEGALGAPASESVRTLRAWRERVTAGAGSLPDPIGKLHQVDLGAWAERDPDRMTVSIRFVLPPDFDRWKGHDVVPGSVYVRVQEFDPSDTRYLFTDETGRKRPLGATLRALRAALERDEGVVVDPDGNPHNVSVTDWADRDPDATWLHVEFLHQQRSAPYGFHGSRGSALWHWEAMNLVAPPPTEQ